MSHDCYLGGGPCAACAEEAFLDHVEAETEYRINTLLKAATKDIAGVLRITEDEVRENLWDFIYRYTLETERED